MKGGLTSGLRVISVSDLSFPTTLVFQTNAWDMTELLRRFKLFVTAAEIVKTTQIEGLREAGGNQTFAKVGCGRCYKPITQNGSWFCDRCLQIQDGCVICRETVKGRWTMCQVCLLFFSPHSSPCAIERTSS